MAENIGRKFSHFIDESNPELNEKLKAILPDILKAVADFMMKEFPDKAEELFITSTEGVSQPKMQYYAGKYYEEGFDGSELKGSQWKRLEIIFLINRKTKRKRAAVRVKKLGKF